ncbi:MAG: hypothetical protein ACUVRS_09850 [Armatimonadota bacterium]
MKLETKRALGLAVLGVMVVACVAYVSFSVMGPKRAVPAKMQTSSSKKSDTTDRASAGEPASVELNTAETTQDSALKRRDPFVPVPLTGAQSENADARQTSQSGLPRNNYTLAKNIALPPATPRVQPTQLPYMFDRPRVQVQPQESSPEDEITVTGVVRGENNIAIVRLGENGRYIVREGQVIDGRYRVASVNSGRVVFIYKNRTISIKVGGKKDAK